MAQTNRYPVPRGGYNPSPSRPFTPANDNRPRVRPPMPANDNVPGGWRPRVPPGLGRRAAYMMAARAGLRFVPIVGAILTAAELLQLAGHLLGMLNLPEQVPDGFIKHKCPPPLEPFWIYSLQGNLCGNYNENNPTPLEGDFIADAPWPGMPSFYEWGRRTTFPSQIVRAYYERVGPIGDTRIWPERTIPQPLIPFLPWFDPLTPPLQPQLEPVPLPVRRPVYDPFPNPETDIPPEGYNPPRGRIDSPPSAGPAPQQAQRPGRREKERKVMANSTARRLLGWALSQYSEVGDLVDALYDALPNEFQNDADKTIVDKIQTMYKHWDKVDMAEAMGNIVNDQVTDPKFAEAFKKMQDTFESYGMELPDLRGTSGTSGPWWS